VRGVQEAGGTKAPSEERRMKQFCMSQEIEGAPGDYAPQLPGIRLIEQLVECGEVGDANWARGRPAAWLEVARHCGGMCNVPVPIGDSSFGAYDDGLDTPPVCVRYNMVTLKLMHISDGRHFFNVWVRIK